MTRAECWLWSTIKPRVTAVNVCSGCRLRHVVVVTVDSGVREHR